MTFANSSTAVVTLDKTLGFVLTVLDCYLVWEITFMLMEEQLCVAWLTFLNSYGCLHRGPPCW